MLESQLGRAFEGSPQDTLRVLPDAESHLELEPANIQLGSRVSDPSSISVDGHGSIAIRPVAAGPSRLPADLVGSILNDEKAATEYRIDSSTRMIVQATDQGTIQTLIILEDEASPTTYEYELTFPEDAFAEVDKAGGVEIFRNVPIESADLVDSETTVLGTKVDIAYISPPWAYDTDGAPVAISQTVEGNRLIVSLDTTGASYPIVADPEISLSCSQRAFTGDEDAYTLYLNVCPDMSSFQYAVGYKPVKITTNIGQRVVEPAWHSDECSSPVGPILDVGYAPICQMHDYCWDLDRVKSPYNYPNINEADCDYILALDIFDSCLVYEPWNPWGCSYLATAVQAAVGSKSPPPNSKPSGSWPYGDTAGEYNAGTFRLRNWMNNGEVSYYDSIKTITVSQSGCAVRFSGDWNGNGYDQWGCRSSSGWWYLEGVTPFHYGLGTDKPVVGDWNGNEQDTVGVVRGGKNWYLSNNFADSTQIFFGYGSTTDTKHVVGDWDGNGTDTPGVIRGNVWYLRNSNSSGNANLTFGYGSGSDTEYVIGDWNNNGVDGIGVVRTTTWHLRYTATTGSASLTFNYGTSAGTPVPGNWNKT